MPKAVFDFSGSLVEWYLKNHRKLPWRETSEPYAVWLSEIILQQTRVDQGLPYYIRFLEHYPTLSDFSKGSEDEILKLWQGLGYYSRARNMMSTANEVMSRYNGKFPDNYNDLIGLKGIGPYTAAAIASFSFNQPHAVVDGNVIRVISRVFGLYDDAQTGPGKAVFTAKANDLINKKHPGLFNQAIMEFGSLQCRPAKPDCSVCPIASHCFAYATGKVSQLPVKAVKQKIRTRYFHYLLINSDRGVWIRKRPIGDIWAGLYEFPLIETNMDCEPHQLTQLVEWKNYFGKHKPHIKSVSHAITHKLSHQLIIGKLYEVRIAGKPPVPGLKDCTQVSEKEIHRYAIPRLVEKLLERQ